MDTQHYKRKDLYKICFFQHNLICYNSPNIVGIVLSQTAFFSSFTLAKIMKHPDGRGAPSWYCSTYKLQQLKHLQCTSKLLKFKQRLLNHISSMQTALLKTLKPRSLEKIQPWYSRNLYKPLLGVLQGFDLPKHQSVRRIFWIRLTDTNSNELQKLQHLLPQLQQSQLIPIEAAKLTGKFMNSSGSLTFYSL